MSAPSARHSHLTNYVSSSYPSMLTVGRGHLMIRKVTSRKCGLLALIRTCMHSLCNLVQDVPMKISSGGGNDEDLELDRFGPALRWMSYEAIHYGLKIEDRPFKWLTTKPTPSMNWWWKLFEYLPFTRLSYENEDSTV